MTVGLLLNKQSPREEMWDVILLQTADAKSILEGDNVHVKLCDTGNENSLTFLKSLLDLTQNAMSNIINRENSFAVFRLPVVRW